MYTNPDQAHPHPATWGRVPMPPDLQQNSSSPKNKFRKVARWLYSFLFAGNATSPPLYQYLLICPLISFLLTKYYPTFTSTYIGKPGTPRYPVVLIGTYTLLWNLGVLHWLWKVLPSGRPPLWQVFVFAGGVTWVGTKRVPGYKDWIHAGRWRCEGVRAVLGLAYSGCWKGIVFLRGVKREADGREEKLREKDEKMKKKNDPSRPPNPTYD